MDKEDDLSETIQESAKHRKRYFTFKQREACWLQAASVPGRDPTRWRLDNAGNVLFKKFIGCQGCLCYEFDHIVPYTKGGDTEVENCQILQTRVNRAKSDKTEFTQEHMRNASCRITYSERELDLIELSVFGNVNRKNVTYNVKSIGEDEKEMGSQGANFKANNYKL